MAVQKLPPPPPIAGMDPAFNRWLVELTRLLDPSGTIDPSNVQGLPELETEVAALAVSVGELSVTVGNLQLAVGTLQTQVAGLATDIAALDTRVDALEARAQVFTGAGAPAAGLGAVGDWYGDPAGAVGARIWIKTAPAVWTAFPF